jgi:two-component system LytT family response regulator
MKAIVVEDSRLAREGLIRMLKDFAEVDVIGQADHPSTALALIQELHPDVLFLDIHMPGETGFDLLEKLDYTPRIIFTTAYSDYAIRSFDYHTVDYLLKPISPERLAQAIRKLSDKAQDSAEGLTKNGEDSETTDKVSNQDNKGVLDINNKIFIKDGERCFLVSLESIQYIESSKNYVQIFFNNKKAYVKKSLNSIEERLPKKHFFRASRQHIVNLQAIGKIEESMSDGYKITMNDGKVLEISRRNAAELKDLLSF